MEILFVENLQADELHPGDCVIELPLDGEAGDRFSVRERGIVTLGHHDRGPDLAAGVDLCALTCAAWQAYLLALLHPDWRPRRIVRPSWPVNFDDVLAELLVDPATRPRILALKVLPRLLHEIAVTDVAGPAGYRALAAGFNDRLLLHALRQRVGEETPLPLNNRLSAGRQRRERLCRALLDADRLVPCAAPVEADDHCILREDGETLMVQAETPGAMMHYYAQGYRRVIVVTPRGADGRRRCTVGQAGALAVDDGGMLAPQPVIDWDRANAREPGWGGRTTIGGGPRAGSLASDNDLWCWFRLAG